MLYPLSYGGTLIVQSLLSQFFPGNNRFQIFSWRTLRLFGSMAFSVNAPFDDAVQDQTVKTAAGPGGELPAEMG